MIQGLNVRADNSQGATSRPGCVMGRLGKVGVNVTGCACRAASTARAQGCLGKLLLDRRTTPLMGDFYCNGVSTFCARTGRVVTTVGGSKTRCVAFCVR